MKVIVGLLSAFVALVTMGATSASPVHGNQAKPFFSAEGRSSYNLKLAKDKSKRKAQLAAIRERLNSRSLTLLKTRKGGDAGVATFGDSCEIGSFEDESVCIPEVDTYIITDEAWFQTWNGESVQVLEKVELTGASCSIYVQSAWGGGYAACDDVRSLFDQPWAQDTMAQLANPTSFKDVISAFSVETKDLLFPKLPTCAKTASGVANLDSDDQQNYKGAVEAIVKTYSGSWPAVNVGQRVDVKYPDGGVFTFSIIWMSSSPKSVLVALLGFADKSGPCS